MDPDSLQTFLANAFVVQESGLERRSLTALVEIQSFFARQGSDLSRGMQLIADHALRVAGASGVSLGLLRLHELVYLAGSGTAAKDVGRRVPAVLSASAEEQTKREILRVENAAIDPRIQAEICRQFGAMSLLMLPIYKKHELAGVLQVLFEAPHAFEEHEVRVYRLMVGALEEAMLRAAQPGQAPASYIVHSAESAEATVSTAHSLAAASGAINRVVPDGLDTASLRPVAPGRMENFRQYLVQFSGQVRSRSNALASTIQRFVARPVRHEVWNAGAAIGVAVALSTVIWISQLHHASQAKNDLSLPTSHGIQQPERTDAGTATEEQKSIEATPENSTRFRGFRRVRVGPAEVDYVSDDVTIRHFETQPAKAQVRTGAKEVKFGNDVTLRYFVRPAVVSESSDTSEASPKTQIPAQIR